MADKIRKEIESKEALDAHMQKHCEEQNCSQQFCQNYLSQIADFSKRQEESASQPFILNSNLPDQLGDHLHYVHSQQQQQPDHFHHGYHHGNHHYGN